MGDLSLGEVGRDAVGDAARDVFLAHVIEDTERVAIFATWSAEFAEDDGRAAPLRRQAIVPAGRLSRITAQRFVRAQEPGTARLQLQGTSRLAPDATRFPTTPASRTACA